MHSTIKNINDSTSIQTLSKARIQMNTQLCTVSPPVSVSHAVHLHVPNRRSIVWAIGIPARIYIQLRVRVCLVSACSCLCSQGLISAQPCQGSGALCPAPRPAFWFQTIWFPPSRLSLGSICTHPVLLLICCWLALINAFFDVGGGSLLFEASCRWVLFTCESLSSNCRVSIKSCSTPALPCLPVYSQLMYCWAVDNVQYIRIWFS